MLVGDPHPVFAANPALAGIEEVRHHGSVSERMLVFIHGFHFDETNASIPNGVIVVVALCLLNDDFILQLLHLGRNAEDCSCIAKRDACRSSQGECRRGSRSNQRSLAPQALGKIFAGCNQQLIQLDGMLGSECDCRLHLRRHSRCREHCVGPCGIDKRRDTQLLVIVDCFRRS